jgi:high-affinity iron transporter
VLGVALLVFREVLEAALIISIVCAATRGVPRRGIFVAGGIGLGVAGALLVALCASFIANLAGGAGQDVFNAAVLLAAVLMIGWHVVWMSAHGREMAREMQAVGGAVKAGSRSLVVLLTVVALAVLREGSEIVLFLYGMAAGGIGAAGLALGIVLGIGGGALMGFALYFGLLRIPLQHFFSVTNTLLMLLAAGLAAAAAGFLVQSDLLPAWGAQVWDTSHFLSDDSVVGRTFGILIGYKAAPEGIQVVFYLTTIALLVIGVRWQQRRASTQTNSRRIAAAGATFLALALNLSPAPVRADDFIVYPPYLIESQNEIELRGYSYADARTDLKGSAAELSIAHGVNSWWKPELYLVEYQQTPAAGGSLQGYEFENTFQLTAQGQYWADIGFLASYERNTAANTPDAIEFGPLVEKTAGRFAHIVNLIWEKQVGAGAGGNYEFRYSYSGTYSVSPAFRPGLEAYGRRGDHAYQAGPIATGEWHVPGTSGNLEYRVGVVLGLNADAPRQTWLARLEYEFF